MQRLTVLVIDGDHDARCRADDILGGWRVLHAPSTAASDELLGAERIDLILVEVCDEDGAALDCIRRICGRFDPPPVVVLSTDDTDDMHAAAVDAGAVLYLLKTDENYHFLERHLSHVLEVWHRFRA